MVELLTRNCVQIIYQGENEGKNELQSAVVQILNVKKFTNPEGTADRYRLLISDGSFYMNAMVSAHAFPQIASGEVGKDGLIRLTAWSLSVVNARKILILLNVEVADRSVQGRLGDPVNIETATAEQLKKLDAAKGSQPPNVRPPPVQHQQAPPQQYQAAARPQMSAPAPKPAVPAQRAPQSSFAAPQTNAGSGSAFQGSVVPIKTLNPYSNKWTIKARVANKSEMRTWSNAKGDGQLFSVTLIDQSGEIKATCFNETALSFFPQVEENKVYYISHGAVKVARKQYSSVQNDYEITFDQKTEISECTDAASVPTVRYNFVPIERLFDFQKDSVIDMIAIVKDVGEVASITAKATQRQMTKRELVLIDQTSNSVNLTLWGKQAENFSAPQNAVIAFKGVRVSDFNGRSLSASSSSSLVINPDIPEAYHLRGWFDSMNGEITLQSMSNAPQNKRAGVVTQDRKFLVDIQNEGLGQNEKPDYITVRALTGTFKSDRNMWYNACPGENCSKKVTQENNEWRCEKCMRTYSYCDYRYIMNINVVDATGSAWVQCFNEVAELLLGHSAAELNQLKEADNTDALQAVLDGASHKLYLFKLKVKQESYNDEMRIRSSVFSADPVNYIQESNYLVDLINQYN